MLNVILLKGSHTSGAVNKEIKITIFLIITFSIKNNPRTPVEFGLVNVKGTKLTESTGVQSSLYLRGIYLMVQCM